MIRTLLRRWHALFDIGPAPDEETAAVFRARQIMAVVRLTPVSLVGNLLNLLIVWQALHGWVNAVSLHTWALCSLAAILYGLAGWWRGRRRPPPRTASRRTLRAASRNAAVLALIWAVVPALFFSRADTEISLLIAIVSAGMLLGGGFVLATVPPAALTYVGIMLAGCAAGLLRDGAARNLDILLLLTVYAGVVIATVTATGRTFAARLVAEAEAQHQKDLVSLLLKDFESNASDWLWETDPHGALRHISDRMRQVFGLPPGGIAARTALPALLRRLQGAGAQGESSIRRLEALLRSGAPFRDLTIAVEVGGVPQWWSLTATPLFSRHGALTGWRGVGSDVTERRRSMAELARLANTDSLTGLANRHALHTRLGAMIDEAEQPFALLYFDLDNFKDVNDSLGHAAGDELLRQVSRRLRAATGSGDTLARLGGDEFAVVCMRSGSTDQAARRAARLLEAVREACTVDGRTLQVGSSVGIALFPEHGRTVEELIRHADMALYAAKEAGRNTWQFFHPSLNAEAQQRLTLQSELALALERRELELHYQPQVELPSGFVRGFEALIRWRHPVHGLVPPGRFIPLAEECGLMVPIGNFVLQEACATAARWPGNARVAVNVSAVQFARSNVLEQVAAALRTSGLPPGRLELEVTESVLIEDEDGARETLAALRGMGVGVALDDFGTGYSSLAYLRDFPLTKLKIDRSFVAALTSDRSAVAIVRSIVLLARELELEVVAEGIETQDEAAALLALDCRTGQGQLYAAALPAAALGPYLAAPASPAARPQDQHAAA